jgi:hypothetical protein
LESISGLHKSLKIRALHGFFLPLGGAFFLHTISKKKKEGGGLEVLDEKTAIIQNCSKNLLVLIIMSTLHDQP